MRSLREQMAREMETFKERDQEMRIVNKQAKREKRNGFGQQLFDAIFDIANEAYIHQQKQDSEEIDPRNWHEWLQLFINELPVTSEKKQMEVIAIENEYDEVIPLEEEINNNLNQVELVDYLQNKGQWPATLISDNQPNLEHFLTG